MSWDAGSGGRASHHVKCPTPPRLPCWRCHEQMFQSTVPAEPRLLVTAKVPDVCYAILDPPHQPSFQMGDLGQRHEEQKNLPAESHPNSSPPEFRSSGQQVTRMESIHTHTYRYSICVWHVCIYIKVSHNLKKMFLRKSPHCDTNFGITCLEIRKQNNKPTNSQKTKQDKQKDIKIDGWTM